MSWKFPFGGKKPAVVQTDRNDAVRQALSDQSDDGSAVRHVVHYAYPASSATDLSTRPLMITDLERRGFDVRDAAADSGLIFEHHRSVASSDFDALTDQLEAWFEARGWSYDGWECEVIKDGLN